MHPFSLLEFSKNPNKNDLKQLLKFGGFPEPFLNQSETKWQKEKIDRLLIEDIRSLEHVKDLNLIEILADILPNRVGSPLSIKSIREDLEVAHATAEKWIQILERFYFCFRIAPFGAPAIRAVKKEKKLYLFDWSIIKNQGVRFENLVASQLLKYCHFHEDTQGYRMELQFARDIDGREIDFVVLKDKIPIFSVEVKTKPKQVSKSISYFQKRTKIPKFYQVHLEQDDYKTDIFRVLPFTQFCKELKMP